MHTSFWEHDAMLDADAIVVGGGIIGLQTALELRALRPHDRIVLLERGLLPAGASSRNAGFACFGSLTEILHDIETLGAEAAVAVVERRWRGLQRLRARLGDDAMGYEALGGFELLLDAQIGALDRIEEVNAHLRPLFRRPVFALDPGLPACGFGAQVKALVRNPFEGQLHSGRMMRALALLAAREGIEIHTGAEVTGLDDDGTRVEVRVQSRRGLTFRASRVAVCTNGITSSVLPECGIVPGRGQILVTAPVDGLPWRGTYHLDEGFFYFRNIGDRILLGGGRNLDFAGEQTAEMALSDTIQSALEAMLRDIIVPGRMPRIEHRWSGIMGFAPDRMPIARRVSERVVLGFGCNGMGVALGTDIAAETAKLLCA
jgi:glycine/D-amino acid oxidase-like deaminating enzyme